MYQIHVTNTYNNMIINNFQNMFGNLYTSYQSLKNNYVFKNTIEYIKTYNNLLLYISYENNDYSNNRLLENKSMIKNESNDFIWLSKEIQYKCSLLYSKNIDIMNDNYILEKGIIDINYCCNTNSFTDSLYLQYMYLQGHIWGSPLGNTINVEYIIKRHNILVELCIRGVFILDGCEPIHQSIKSRFKCIVLIRNDDYVYKSFLQFLENIFLQGINVLVRKIVNKKIVQNIAYIRDDTKTLFSEDLHVIKDIMNNNEKNICNRLNVSGFSNNCTPNKNEELMSKYFSMYYIDIWSQTNDNSYVEDTFLQLWIKYNSIYGFKNYDLYVY
jgi:hypothetical protein